LNQQISFTLNGKPHTLATDPDRPLIGVLREDLGLHGTRFGCGEAQCAACTVLVNGERTYSCRMAISEADGQHIQTVEGLATGEKLHPVQQAFLDEGAYQCGYCTSGMIMGAVALLADNPHPTDDQIIQFMNRHLCRCCGYVKIIAAIKRAAATGGAQ
jgi:aerobic-type carbon monoxide dehydrogenase small subunit (CoxS/CutS family)